MRKTVLTALTLAALLALSPAAITAAPKKAESKKSKKDAPVTLNHKVKTIAKKDVNLADKYAGQVVMFVNVASRCGATPQYRDLEAMYKKYKDKGFVILGFPCNQFGKQEPGTEEEIIEFCEENYGVTFPMFAKIDVKGKNQAPLYKVLTSKEHNPDDPGDVRWNFEKILLARDGTVAARFRTRVNPSDKKVVSVVEKELAKPAPTKKKKD